jgi:predicted metalloendopeptidase
MNTEGEKDRYNNNYANNSSNGSSNLRPFEVDFIQRLFLRGLKEDEIQVDYGLPIYTIDKIKSQIALRQGKEKFSKKEEEALSEVMHTLKLTLRESIDKLDSVAQDPREPADIKIKAKELRATFIEDLRAVLEAETSSDPHKTFNEVTERRLWRRGFGKI